MYLFDRFTNFLSGMGVVGRDKLVSSQYVTQVFTREQLEASFRSDWIARKAISIPAYDATREWRGWQAKQDQIEKLEETEHRLGLQLKLQQALTKARLYGGCVMLIGVDGNTEKELDPETIKKDGLKFIHVLAPHQVVVEDLIKDLEDPYYGQPEFYTLRDETKKFGDVKVHPSRMVRLIGNDTPDPMSNFGWGDPLLQMIHDAVNAAGTVSQSIATLIAEAKLDVIKIPGLTEIFSTDAGTSRLIKRFTEANVAKSVINGIIMDAEEEWQRIGVDFSGMPEILQMYLQIAAGAADIPSTRFLGRSPAGLNATGESDLQNYYDRIASDQQLRLTPALEKLDIAIQRSALGKYDENIFYNWNSLWQMDEGQRSEIDKRKAETAMIDVNSGLVPPEALMKGRINQLIEDGTYPGLEAAVDEALAAQELLEEQEAEAQLLLAPPDRMGFMKEEEPAEEVVGDGTAPFSDRAWDEHLHPRGEDGKWVSSGSSETGASPDEEMTPVEIARHRELEERWNELDVAELTEYTRLNEKFDKEWDRKTKEQAAKRVDEAKEWHKQGIKTYADSIAKRLGFDPSRIDVVEGTREFMVNGVKHTAAGDADIYNSVTPLPGEGRIRLYVDHPNVHLGTVGGITAHEVEHFKFQHALNTYRAEYDAMMKDPGPAGDPNHQYGWGRAGGSSAMMRPDGMLRPPYDEKYPTYTAMQAALYQHPIDEFAKGDGVSKYSAEYWKGTYAGTVSYDIALHETLAEMAKMHLVNNKMPEHWGFSPVIRERNETRPTPAGEDYVPKPKGKAEGQKLWRDLYRTVEKLYKARK